MPDLALACVPSSMEWAVFADHLMGLGLAERTVTYYVRRARHADEWLREQGSDLCRAKAALIGAYASTLPNSHSTRGQVASALGHYWDWVDRPNPPIRAIRVPPQPLMLCRALEPDQASHLKMIASGWWPEGASVLFGLYLALRREEIAKAEWSRFDLPMEWYTVTGKNSKTATLPVHPVLRAELGRHRRPGSWVFPGRFGSHVTPATIWDWTRLVAIEADLPYLTTHQLRHTSLATANDNLGDLRAVMEFARHADPGVTSGYTRTSARRLQDVVRALDY